MAIKVEVFSSDSCPHCPGAIKVAEEAKADLTDLDIDLDIVNINTEENRKRAIDYQIMAVPTIVINGQVEFIGAPSKEEFVAKLKSI